MSSKLLVVAFSCILLIIFIIYALNYSNVYNDIVIYDERRKPGKCPIGCIRGACNKHKYYKDNCKLDFQCSNCIDRETGKIYNDKQNKKLFDIEKGYYINGDNEYINELNDSIKDENIYINDINKTIKKNNMISRYNIDKYRLY